MIHGTEGTHGTNGITEAQWTQDTMDVGMIKDTWILRSCKIVLPYQVRLGENVDPFLNPRGQHQKKLLHRRKKFPETALAVLGNLLMLVLWQPSVEDLLRRKADM